MGFRIGLGVAIVWAAVVIGTAVGPVTPAHAAATDLSYNEISRVVMGGPSPAPGSYNSGSFDGDFAAATKKQGGGLFGMVKNAMSALNAGIGSSLYYLNNMERDDDVKNQTGTITIADKQEIIHLDYGAKTYWISTPNPNATMPPMAAPQPQAQQSMAPPQPGTAKVAITVATTSLGSKNLGGVDTDGYQITFKIVSTNATGSCKNGTFETSLIEFVSSYPEPQLHYPMPAHMMPRPSAQALEAPEAAAMGPGCTPKVTARVHQGPTAPSDRLVMWELLTLNMGTGTGRGGGFATVIERGDVKPLGAGDAGLFAPPAGFKQVQSQD